MSCYQNGSEILRMCDARVVSATKIEGTDFNTTEEIVVLFKDEIFSYCWGQHFTGKYVFYFAPEDHGIMTDIINDDGCISFFFTQATVYRLRNAHYFES